MSNDISVPTAPATRNKLDLVPSAAGLTAGGTVATAVSSATLGKTLAAVTAAGTLASGSYLPAVAAATITGVELVTGWPVIRVGFALAAAVATGLAARLVIKLGRAGVDIATNIGSAVVAVKEAVLGNQRPSTGGARRSPQPQYTAA